MVMVTLFRLNLILQLALSLLFLVLVIIFLLFNKEWLNQDLFIFTKGFLNAKKNGGES